MPSAAASTKKRKLADSTGPSKSTKKSKSKSSSTKTAVAKRTPEEIAEETQDKILELEEAILESPKNYNNIVTLFGYLTSKDDFESDVPGTAAIALCRIFIRLMSIGRLNKKKAISDAEAAVATWLKERYNEYFTTLCTALTEREDEKLQGVVLHVLTRLLKEEATHLKPASEECYFPHESFGKVVKALLLSEVVSEEIKMKWVEDYVNQYDDVRYAFYTAAGNVLSDADSVPESLLPQLVNIALSLQNLPSSEHLEFDNFYAIPASASPRKLPPILTASAHRRQFQTYTLALLRLPLPEDSLKPILSELTTHFLPCFPSPHTLLDFLLSTYDRGGPTLPLLSLQGIFHLIAHHNLDFPDFYPRLYALLNSSILHVRYRSTFFRLLEIFLGSTHLPAALIASFIKRLSRLSLHAPPGAIVAIVPFVYNLFQKHRTTTYMMHRVPYPGEKEEWDEKGYPDDVFDEKETDPMKTRAIESCIWELETQMKHWQPNVATLARILGEQFTKESYVVEDFLDHGYGSMFDAEIRKEIKKAPVVETEIPKRIFERWMEEQVEEKRKSAMVPVQKTEPDVLVDIWDFSS